MGHDDTIFALSSAPGRAGVAVVRVSGPRAGAALSALAGGLPPPRHARLAQLRDPRDGQPVDRGLVLWLPAPGSVTGEDVAELHLHGGRAVVAAALEALGAVPGLRPAEAGEFTRRAFDNGRLDLSQVEGLADLIDAATEAQRRQALRQFGGALSRRTEAWRETLVGALAHLEAVIEFADEGLPQDLEGGIWAKVSGVKREILESLADGHRGERLREGCYVAIIGPPNAGKSSILNALARREAAIVSATAGTTRDVIEVHLELAGYPVILADTAGLRELAETEGQAGIEAEGVRRARAGAAAADLKLAVFDITAGTLDPAMGNLLDENSLIVLNKADLERKRAHQDLCALRVSALTGQGLPALEKALTEAVAVRLGEGDAPSITRARHRWALQDCAEALERASEAQLADLAAEDLRLAARALGRIAGRVDVEDVLEVIFRDFCIGK